MNATAATTPLDETARRRAMRRLIALQFVAGPSLAAFTNNLVFLYLASLGIASERILTLISLWMLGVFASVVPCARFCDRHGIKGMGYVGQIVNIAGFVLMAAVASLPRPMWTPLLYVSVLCVSIGWAMFAGGWYALLDPIVPENQRGRFFGALRFMWQTSAILFMILVLPFLSKETPGPILQGIIGALCVGLVARFVLYRGIPEIAKPSRRPEPFWESTMNVLRLNNYASFLAYIFLLMLFVGCCPTVFGLIEKRALDLTDRAVAVMGGLLVAGSMVGFIAGGQAVDRYGTKTVFIACHLSFALCIFAFLSRGLFPWSATWTVGAMSFVYGGVMASSSVAMSSEMMALIPARNKSLAAALYSMMVMAGMGLSNLFSGKAIALGFLKENWTFLGATMTRYDAILLACGTMVLLLVVTLGLVPSVIAKSQWAPRNY